MKLIIDIPEDVYTRLFDNGVPMSFADGIVIDRALRLGKPLTKHDEEIITETVESIWGKPPYTEVLDKIKSYVDYIKNTGMGKKKSLEFIKKYVEGLKVEKDKEDKK